MRNYYSFPITAFHFATNEPQSCAFCEGGKTFLYKIHPEWDVHYFLSVESAGHDPKSCAKQAESGALVYADNTSIELNMIFPLKSQNINFDGIIKTKEQWKQIHEHDVCSLIPFDKRGMNNQRLELLKGCIYYGHIVRGSNHYAYYLDFSRYFEKIQQSGVYDAWLTELCSKENYSNAFNIIVTPLRTGTSPLLKDFVDRVFKHSIHILQLDLHNVRRTDIRAKYRHIALECAETIQKDPTTQINIYYVDDSLVTAETLQRGYNLVSMLLMDCFDKNMDKISLFKGVFVLVNRSSRDTVQTFVKNPDSDFHAFVHLANPHYIVSIIQSYQRLEKNYGKEGAAIIQDNCQLTIAGGFAPTSETADIISRALGSRTVMTGSVSRGHENASQSLQMTERPLMSADELKSMKPGSFVVMKTGSHPFISRLKLFTQWGIEFDMGKCELIDKAASEVHYAGKDSIVGAVDKVYPMPVECYIGTSRMQGCTLS